MNAADACPCGSGATYAGCCGPLLDGRLAVTAEALMRSRYTAYVVGHEDHLFRTWHPRTRPDDVTLEPGVAFTGLEVLATTDGGADDAIGTVSFVARSSAGDLRETSRFERRAGRWFYLDGDVS